MGETKIMDELEFIMTSDDVVWLYNSETKTWSEVDFEETN